MVNYLTNNHVPVITLVAFGFLLKRYDSLVHFQMMDECLDKKIYFFFFFYYTELELSTAGSSTLNCRSSRETQKIFLPWATTNSAAS